MKLFLTINSFKNRYQWDILDKFGQIFDYNFKIKRWEEATNYAFYDINSSLIANINYRKKWMNENK